MTFRNQIAWTLVLQGGGAVAGLASFTLLGVVFGPVSQGGFSLIKVEIAFIGSLALLGLTQSIFYHVQSRSMPIKRAKEVAVVMALVGGISALCYGAIAQNWKGIELIAFSFACVTYVWFGILRGIVLAVTTTRFFNLISVMPQGLLLLYVGCAVLLEHVNNFEIALAFMTSYGVSAVFGIYGIAAALRLTKSVPMRARLPDVIKFGFASGVAEVAASISLLLSINAVGTRFGMVELGVFTFAVTLAQGLLLPISYTVPLLFKRWMEHPGASDSIKGAILVVAIVGGLAVIIRYVLDDILPRSWLGEYLSMTYFLWIMLLAAAFDGSQRILAAYANAQGAPWVSASSEILRLAIVGSCLLFLPIVRVSDVAWIVCIAAMSSSMLLFAVHRRMKWTMKELA